MDVKLKTKQQFELGFLADDAHRRTPKNLKNPENIELFYELKYGGRTSLF